MDKIRCDMNQDYVFVSYSKQDKDIVYPLVERLRMLGCNIWIDEELKNQVGIDWQNGALGAIKDSHCKAILFMLSENSMKSAPVFAELVWSQKSRKVLRKHDESPLKIIPINTDKIWEYSKTGLTEWVKDISGDDELLSERDYECLKDPKCIDESYYKGTNMLEEKGEIAEAIFKEIFEPLGGGKITIASREEIATIRENIPKSVFNQRIPEPKAVPEPKAISEPTVKKPPVVRQNISTGSKNEPAIGEHVKQSMRRLQESGFVFASKMFNDLFDKAASKRMFSLSYPFFVDSKEKIKDDKGHNRYWAEPFRFNGRMVYITSQWYNFQRPLFDAWYNGLTEKNTNSSDHTANASSSIVTYTLYGNTYTENQSKMMLRVFKEVLERHTYVVPYLPDCYGMNCVSRIDYTIAANKTSDMKSYFRACDTFHYPTGSVCVGPACSFADKLTKIAILLETCHESRDILASENFTLPEIDVNKVTQILPPSEDENVSDNEDTDDSFVKSRSFKEEILHYTLFGQDAFSNQSTFLVEATKQLLERHPDKITQAADEIKYISLTDYSVIRKKDRLSYFKSFSPAIIHGINISIGKNLSKPEKIRYLKQLIVLCEESEDCVLIDGKSIMSI